MNTFPTLSTSYDLNSFTEQNSPEAVQVASFDSGHSVLNERFTFDPLSWTVQLICVSQLDKESVVSFYDTNKGLVFLWHNDQDDMIYEVIFVQPPVCRIQGENNLWTIELGLRQASSTASGPVGSDFYGGATVIEVEELESGVSITDRPIFSCGLDFAISSIGILTKGPPWGIDNSNTAVIVVKRNDGTTVVTKTYNTATQPPSTALGDLGTILSSPLADDEWLNLTMTQTGTAHMPAFSLIIAGYFS